MMWGEPVGGVSPAHGDAPRMDAKDSVGFRQSCLFIKVLKSRDTNYNT